MKPKTYRHEGRTVKSYNVHEDCLLNLGRLAQKRHYIDVQIAEEVKRLETYIKTGGESEKPKKAKK